MSIVEEAPPPQPQTAKVQPTRTGQADNLSLAFALIPKAQMADREALNQIAEYLQPFCLRLVSHHFAHSPKLLLFCDVDDIANEILHKITQKICQVDVKFGEKSFEFWMKKLARNTIVDLQRKVKSRLSIINASPFNEEVMAVTTVGDQTADAPADITRVRDYIRETLPATLREPLEAALMHPEAGQKKLAALCGIRESTFRSSLSRARSVLARNRDTLLDILNGQTSAADLPREH